MALKENSSCIDGLLWIGNAPSKYRTVAEFIKEARVRGCCRQLPCVPGWMVCGKTKVFLAHRDRHKTKRRGSIFGYFVVHRIEIITPDRVAKELYEKEKADCLWPRNTKEYITLIKKGEEQKLPQKEIKRLLKAKLQHEHMPDIAKAKTGKKPPREDKYTRLIGQILNQLLKKWLAKPGGGSFIPMYMARIEAHRMCSIRNKKGAIYLVCAKAAEICRQFAKLLNQLGSDLETGQESDYFVRIPKHKPAFIKRTEQLNYGAYEEWQKSRKQGRTRWAEGQLVEHYEAPFRTAVEQVGRYGRPRYPIDRRLEGKYELYGELVVFHRPFPILERAPQAAFRGISRIDGDKLIDQIARHKAGEALIPKIYYCGENRYPENRPIRTKEQLVTYLAQEVYVSKAYVQHLLHRLAVMTRNQLLDFDVFELPGIGRIKIKRLHITENRSRKKVVEFFPVSAISARATPDRKGKKSKQIKFSPYKPISELLTGKRNKQQTGKRGKAAAMGKKKQLSIFLAKQLNLKNGIVNRFLDELAKIAHEQLAEYKKFRLPGIGIIYI